MHNRLWMKQGGPKVGGRSLKKKPSTTSSVVLPYSPVSFLATTMYASCKITSSTLLRWSLFNRVPRGESAEEGASVDRGLHLHLGFMFVALCVASRYRVAKANLCSRSRSSRANESRSLGGLIGGCIVNHPIKAAYPWKGEPPPA